jgi:hypothetical protein
MSSARKVALWLFVVNLGIAFGAGLYEARITVPGWIETTAAGYRWDAEAAREADTGRRFWVYVTTGPLTLLTLASLVAAWRAPQPLRTWWLAAAAFAVADRVFTFSYFIPTMVRLTGAEAAAPDAVEQALRWASLNHVRHALSLAAWLSALRALSLLGRYDR